MRSVSVLSIVLACSAVVVSESNFDDDNFNDDEDSKSYDLAEERRDYFAEHQPNVTEERTVTSEKRSDGMHHKVTITKTVHVPFTVQVEKRVPKIIEVPVDKPFNVYVPKPYPVYVEKKVPFEIKVPLPQPYTVEKKVPYPVKVLVDKPYTVHVPKPYPVEVEKKYEFNVEKKVPVEYKVPVKRPYPVHVIVEKEVKYPVETKVPVAVQVPYDKPVPIHVQKYVPVHVDKPMPYTVEQISTYPVHVPLKIPIKVHHPEGQHSNLEGVNEQNLQQLDWMEANTSPQKVAIKGFEHQKNNFRPSMPNRQPFSGGFRQMPMHYNRGNGGRLAFTRNLMPFMGGQGHNIPNYHPKSLNYHAPQGMHHVPFHFQNPNSQLKTQYPVKSNTQQSQSSYKVNEVPSESWTGYVQKPDSNVKSHFPTQQQHQSIQSHFQTQQQHQSVQSHFPTQQQHLSVQSHFPPQQQHLSVQSHFPPQQQHLSVQSHTQFSNIDPSKSQTTNTTTATASAPSESPTSFRVTQAVLHRPSTPNFQPLIQQPQRYQPFALKTAGQSGSQGGQLRWNPELHVPSSTFFKQTFPSGQNSSVEVKQASQQSKTTNTFPQYVNNYNAAFQTQKTGSSSFLDGKISVSPMASALTAHQAPSAGQSSNTHLETSSNAQTTVYHGTAQQQTKDKNTPPTATDPQQPISYFGSKTILGENEHSYSSSISHGRNNGAPSRS